MAKSQFFPFFCVDFIHGTQFFTNATVGAYIRCLCEQWDEGFVESEIFETICLGLNEKERGKLFGKFSAVSIKDKTGLQNKRMEETRRDVAKRSKIARQNGELGGFQKHSKHSSKPEANEVANTVAKEKLPNPNPNPNLKSESESKSKEDKDILGTKFEEFWKLVPARNGKRKFKPKAWATFQKIKIEELDLVLQATRNFADSEDVQRNFGIMDPHRFLHSIENRCDPWRDWIEPEINFTKTSKTERNAQSLLEKLKAGRQPTIVNP